MITLSQLRTNRAATLDLRAAAWSDLRDAFLSPKICALLSDESRRVIVSEVEGYDRELNIIATIERDLLGTGKTDLCVLSPSDAPPPLSAVFTQSPDSNASIEVRGASRGPLSKPLPPPFADPDL